MAIRHRRTSVTGDLPQTFHLFTQLPIELRLIIWSYNLPGPRIVEIKCSTDSTEPLLTSQLGQDDNRRIVCTSTSPIPVNLHVCRESRLYGLKQYRLLFGISPQPGRVFFDARKDTLYFGARQKLTASGTLLEKFVSLVQPEDLAQVHRIAINEGLIKGHRSAAQFIAEKILRQAYQHLTNLEQLTFVCNDKNPLYSSDAVFVNPRMQNRILERDVQNAIGILQHRHPRSRPLSWSIRAIAAEPSRPAYSQDVLGYEGTRVEFFRRVQLPECEKAVAKLRCAVGV
ncbi:uncharacterized protein GGS25DRAFT_138286 [Hypoxylon fragiforme]|uniref:uncharacterized protein n=1 Tax=Hypoxylon fragiforme TaxID=63214 RepID=UPI0020C6C915|nr:uncharacterized protein GGS25DRAFT_138286 [Hypoxylon fragiforme]KAI2612840.1 hypothetical protein GGS25DRAFT_138286 [Hypoxylon fragiforme]